MGFIILKIADIFQRGGREDKQNGESTTHGVWVKYDMVKEQRRKQNETRSQVQEISGNINDPTSQVELG